MALLKNRLATTHDVDDFDCGDSALNDYLRQTARQHQKKNISQTYVIVDEVTPDAILGYFTLTIRPMMPIAQLPAAYQRRLPREVPGYTLGRLAVDKRYQGQGIGTDLMMSAIDRVRAAAANVGGWGFFIDAKNERAARFYEDFGFMRLPSTPLTLFAPIAELPTHP